jgi:hypothetical protein
MASIFELQNPPFGQLTKTKVIKTENGAHTLTTAEIILTAGSGVTIVGEPDITADTSGTFIFRVTSSTAVSAFRK